MLQYNAPPEKERGLSFLGKLIRLVDGCDVRVVFDNKPEASMVAIDDPYGGAQQRMHVFASREPVKGSLLLSPSGGSYNHNGIIMELIGSVTLLEVTEQRVVFMRQEKRLEPDTITKPVQLNFCFPALKEYESYRGVRAKVSYHVRATVHRPVKHISVKEEIWVSQVNEALSSSQSDACTHRGYFRETAFGPQSTSMDVGVDDVLHIEFRYDKQIFHLTERVLGKITFKIAMMDIRHGHVGLVRREWITPEGDIEERVHTETLQKFEIMDGTPIQGEIVPIRLYLGAVPRLTPTYSSVHGRLRVGYFLNLVFDTGDGKRYFKQQEITMYRRAGQELLVSGRPQMAIPTLPS